MTADGSSDFPPGTRIREVADAMAADVEAFSFHYSRIARSKKSVEFKAIYAQARGPDETSRARIAMGRAAKIAEERAFLDNVILSIVNDLVYNAPQDLRIDRL